MPSSTLGTILGAVKQRIIDANLTSISSNVLIQRFPWKRDGVTLPVVYVCPIREALPESGTNIQDDTVYGVQVSAAAASNQVLPLDASEQLLEWREKLIELFREKRVSGAGDNYRATVVPGDVYDPEAFKANMDGTTIFLKFTVRKTRT